MEDTILFWIKTRLQGISASIADNGGELDIKLLKALDNSGLKDILRETKSEV